MNIKINYFLYTKNFQTVMFDFMTGTSHKVSFSHKTPATPEIASAYATSGGVGYVADEYSVYRVDETGEEFVYPFSFGYANPEELMDCDRAKMIRALLADQESSDTFDRDQLSNLTIENQYEFERREADAETLAENQVYPRVGYSTEQVFETAESWLDWKRQEIYTELEVSE